MVLARKNCKGQPEYQKFVGNNISYFNRQSKKEADSIISFSCRCESVSVKENDEASIYKTVMRHNPYVMNCIVCMYASED